LDPLWPANNSGLNEIEEPHGLDFGLSLQRLPQHHLAVLELPQRGIGSTTQEMNTNERAVRLL
jgi:hypothetical protein